MSDLCAPIYVVMEGDEELTFWCFVEVMNRMVCKFSSHKPCVATERTSETEFFARPERHEETTINIAAVNRYHGS